MNNRRGMSLLPVLVVGAVLVSLLLFVASQKSTPSAEQQARAKLAAVSAINKVAVNLRDAGSLPPTQVISSDGVDVSVTSQTSADGNTIQIVANSGGEVISAKAVRTPDPAAPPIAPTPASPTAVTPTSATVPNPVVQEFISGKGAYMITRDPATGELRVPLKGGYIVVTQDPSGRMVPTPDQPFFRPVPATPGTLTTPGTPVTPAEVKTKWVVYNSDNVVISTDSSTRTPSQPLTPEPPVPQPLTPDQPVTQPPVSEPPVPQPPVPQPLTPDQPVTQPPTLTPVPPTKVLPTDLFPKKPAQPTTPGQPQLMSTPPTSRAQSPLP